MFRVCLKRWVWVGVWLSAWTAVAHADSLQDYRRSMVGGNHFSISGQFVVRDAPIANTYRFNPGNATNLARLDPDLLVVSCERIKKALLTRLDARDEWRGKIYLDLHHCQDPYETVLVSPMLNGNTWAYRIELPDVMDRSRLVTTLIEVMLLEMANRNADHSAEIPAWLAQGMAREIILSNPADLVVDPPHSLQNGITLNRLTYDNRAGCTLAKPTTSDWMDPLAKAREYLRSVPPLTMEELSWPKEGVLDGEGADAYRYSAQLFVHDLLRLPEGRAHLRATLQELPQHLNWQISFRDAFHSEFASQLALDKWWMLQLVEFTGRDLAQTWASDESWAKLDELIHPTVEVRGGLTDPTQRTQVTLQSVIRNWDVPRQENLFREKTQQLLMLRLRVSQDLVYLVDDYRRVLENYVRIRDRVVYVPMGRTIYAPRVDDVAHDTIRQLDELDARQQQSRPRPATVPTGNVSLSESP